MAHTLTLTTLHYKNNNDSIYIIGVYLPQQKCVIDDFAEYLGELEGVINLCKLDGEIVVIGDVNCHFGSDVSARCWGQTTSQAKQLMKMVRNQNLTIADISEIGNGPTYSYSKQNIGKSYIDHVIVSQKLVHTIETCMVHYESIDNTSDHQGISVGLKVNMTSNRYKPLVDKNVAWSKLTPDEIYINYTLPLQDKLYGLWVDMGRNDIDIEEVLRKMAESMLIISRQNLPQRKFNKNAKPYWRYNKEALNAIYKEKSNAYHKWVENGKPSDNNNPLYTELIEAKKAFRKEQKIAQLEYEKSMMQEIEGQDGVNMNFLWYLFKKAQGKYNQAGLQPIQNENGELLYEPKEIVDEWRNYYSQLFNTPEGTEEYKEFYEQVEAEVIELKETYRNIDEDTKHLEITEEKIRQMIKELAKGKASGYDGIDNEHIIYGGDMVLKITTQVFNSALKQGMFPQNFKFGLLIPIPKPGKKDHTLKGNSRGITLLTSLGKMYEKVVKDMIVEDFQRKDIMVTCNMQGAGQKNVSSMHTSMLLRETITYARDRGSTVYTALLDIEKAFDKVWQNGLLYKLYIKGLSPTLWNIIMDSFRGFRCNIKIGDMQSDWFQVSQGVHQGGPLSGLLFQIYLDDLLHELQNTELGVKVNDLMIVAPSFADDITLVTLSKRNLQILMNICKDHGDKWKYKFSAPKSVVMRFGENKEVMNIKMGDESVKEVESCTHLGIPLYSNCNEELELIEERIVEAYKRVWMLVSIGSRSVQMNPITFSVGYWAVVITKLTYGLFLIPLKQKTKERLDSMHFTVAKRIQGLASNTPNIVPLAGIQWRRISTQIAKESMQFLRQVMMLPMDIVYKKLLVNRITQLDGNHQYVSTGPIQCMMNFIEGYKMKCELDNTLSTGEIMSKSEWNRKVKLKTTAKEEKEWMATKFVYKSMDVFKLINVTPNKSWPWWRVARWDCTLLKKIKQMWRLLFTRNEKSGLNCTCPETPSIEHILFECEIGRETRQREWCKIKQALPQPMVECIQQMNQRQVIIFIYSGFNDSLIKEWLPGYRCIAEAITTISSEWYDKVTDV